MAEWGRKILLGNKDELSKPTNDPSHSQHRIRICGLAAYKHNLCRIDSFAFPVVDTHAQR